MYAIVFDLSDLGRPTCNCEYWLGGGKALTKVTPKIAATTKTNPILLTGQQEVLLKKTGLKTYQHRLTNNNLMNTSNFAHLQYGGE